jgi:hypothetical protein
MRDIPEDNLAYPVLIVFDNGSSGSCFLLNTEQKIYLITAKHVLQDEKGKLRGEEALLIAQARKLNDETRNELSIDMQNAEVLFSKTHDIGAIVIGNIINQNDNGSYTIKYLNSVHMSKKAETGVVHVSAVSATKTINEIMISNEVFMYGYPTSLGLKDSPQFDYSQPLLRKGIIANVYKKQGTLILDCPAYYGNSGGPVVEVEQEGLLRHHKVIGVVSQFIPFVEKWINSNNGQTKKEISNSGYSVAVAMDAVFDLIGFKKNLK